MRRGVLLFALFLSQRPCNRALSFLGPFCLCLVLNTPVFHHRSLQLVAKLNILHIFEKISDAFHFLEHFPHLLAPSTPLIRDGVSVPQ